MRIFFKHFVGLLFGASMVVAIFVFFITPQPTKAVTRTWDGGGVTENWSEDANWSGDVEPGASDIATFDGTSTKNATIDTTISVAGIDVNTGYTGTITQGAGNNVSVGTSNFDMADGFFVGGAATMTLTGSSFVIGSGASFTAPTTISTSSAGTTWNVNTTQIVNNLTISHTVAFTITSGDTIEVDGTLTLNGGALNTGTVNLDGNIVQNSGSSAGSATVHFNDNAVAQTYTINGGTGPALHFDNASDANDSLVFAAAGGLFRLTTTSGFSGTIPISNASNFAMSFQNWSQSGGDYTNNYCSGLCSTMNLGSGTTTFTIASPATFTAPTTINVSSTGMTWDVNSSQTVNNLTVSTTVALTLNSLDTVEISGTLTLTAGSLNTSGAAGTGIFNANGNVVQSSGSAAGSATINFANNSAAQTYTINGGTGPILQLDSASDASDSLVFGAAGGLQQLTVTSAFSGTIPVSNPSNFAMSFRNWSQSAGDFTANYCSGTCSTMNLGSGTTTFTINSPATFTAPTTINISSTGMTWNVNSSQTVNNLNVSTTVSWTITSGDTIVVAGNFAVTAGSVATGNLEVQGNVTQSGGGSISSPTTFSGSGTQLVTFATPSNQNGDVTVNKSGGQVTLASNYDLDAASQDLTIVEGTFDISGFNLNVEGTSGTFVVQDGGVFERYGAETLTLNVGLPTLQTGSTVRYTGDGDSASDTYTVTTMTATYSNLTIASTDGTTDTFQLGAALDVNGNFSNSGTFTTTGSNHAITLAGNWTNTGTFQPNSGTVTLDGTDQTLSGSTTFNNLSKTVTTARTLTLPASSTQTISGTLTLTGTDGNLLSLRSSSTGTRAIISPTGTRVVEYLDVKDNNNTSGTVIACGTTCVNSGNNLGWTFGATSGGSTGYVPPNTGSAGNTITILTPNGGESVTVGDSLTITWKTTGTQIDTVTLSLSRNGGSTYEVLAQGEQNDGTFTWRVAGEGTPSAKLLLEVFDGTTLLNSDSADGLFTILSLPTDEIPPEVIDDTETAPPEIPEFSVGDFVKAPEVSTVYLLAENNTRRPFFNEIIFFTYEKNFSNVKSITAEALATYTVGEPVLPRVGTVLVKTRDSAKVYALEENSEDPVSPHIRWIVTEELAQAMYGKLWADYVIDIDTAVFSNFTQGEPILTPEKIDLEILKYRFELIAKWYLRMLRN